MKLGVFTVLFKELPLEKALDKVIEYGLEAVEIGTGNYPGNAHCNPDELLEDEAKRQRFIREISNHGLTISAFSCHGNPLHPDREFAKSSHDTWRKTVLLAERVGVETVCVFSGCPGDSEEARYPNWVTCTWPGDYSCVLKWQWEQKVIPYWTEEAEFAERHGIRRIAFEMHPGFVVYNPATLLKLRKAVGPSIGANFDPSHLVWQGIDPVAAIRVLGENGAIFHVHAKDVYVSPYNRMVNGVLDTGPYADVFNRAWTFRTVGYGMGHEQWKAIISALRVSNYDYVLSIEHEDPLASQSEGLRKAVEFLKSCLFADESATIWWT
ncbi:MAG: sugar phosphate isomerase/epimerase [Bacillota bacterium]